MKIFIANFALLSLISATPALADEPITFVRDGATYTYTVETKGETRILTGREVGGERFRLRVANGRVAGRVGSRSVSFSVRDVAVGEQTDVAEHLVTR